MIRKSIILSIMLALLTIPVETMAQQAETPTPATTTAASAATDTSRLVYDKELGIESNIISAEDLTLDFGYGVLPRRTAIKIYAEAVPPEWGNFIRVSQSYLVKPAGLELRRDGRVILNYDDRKVPEGKAERDIVLALSTDGKKWETIGTDVRADQNYIEAKIGSFGYLVAAVMIGKNPPKTDFEFSPEIATIGTEVRFTGMCDDPDGDWVHYSWDFDSDGKVDSTNKEAFHTFKKAGDHPVELTCTDGISKSNKVISLAVNPLSFRDYVDKFLTILISAGDWVLYVLFLAGILMVIYIIERSIYFYIKNRFDFEEASRRLREALFEGGVPRAREVMAEYDVPETRILAEAFKYADKYNPETIADLISGEVSARRKRLEKRLTFLGTLGNNAPFIGLFGTVLGIIKAFAELKGGLISPQAIQGEIGEALRATAVGLLVAIPSVIAFNIFSRNVTRIRQNVDALGAILISYLKEYGPYGRQGQADGSGDGKEE